MRFPCSALNVKVVRNSKQARTNDRRNHDFHNGSHVCFDRSSLSSSCRECPYLADPGITMEPSLLRNPGRLILLPPLRSATLDVCAGSSIAAAARGDAAQAAFDRKLSHCGNEIEELRQQGIHYRPLVWTADGRCGRAAASSQRFSMRQTSPPAGTGGSCRRNPFIAGGSTKSTSLSCARGQPWHAQFTRILHRERSGSSQASLTELRTTGDMSPLSTAGLATTTSTTQRLTQQYQTTMTLSW